MTRTYIISPGARLEVGPHGRPMEALGEFGPTTPCNAIPAGDPYRQPGNECAGVKGSLSFDSAGNLVSAGSAGVQPTAADQHSTSLLTPTNIAIGAAVLAVLYGFMSRKRR